MTRSGSTGGIDWPSSICRARMCITQSRVTKPASRMRSSWPLTIGGSRGTRKRIGCATTRRISSASAAAAFPSPHRSARRRAARILARFGYQIDRLGEASETAGPRGPLAWSEPIPLPFLWIHWRTDTTISDPELARLVNSFLLSPNGRGRHTATRDRHRAGPRGGNRRSLDRGASHKIPRWSVRPEHRLPIIDRRIR